MALPGITALWNAILRAVRRTTDLHSRGPDGPCNWCLVGNIVEVHAFGQQQEMLHGTKHFTPGTKVYCLPPQWGDGYENIVVVGLARGSRRWITVVMPSDRVHNWRAKVVYKDAVLRRLRAGYEGRKGQWKSRKDVEAAARSLNARVGPPDQSPA